MIVEDDPCTDRASVEWQAEPALSAERRAFLSAGFTFGSASCSTAVNHTYKRIVFDRTVEAKLLKSIDFTIWNKACVVTNIAREAGAAASGARRELEDNMTPVQRFARLTAAAAMLACATVASANASIIVYTSRAAFDAMSHITVDWSIYGPTGTAISTPDFKTVSGLTLHVASSEGILLRRDEGAGFTGDFAMGDHLVTEDDSLSDSFLVGFDSQTVRGFGMQVEPNLLRGAWNGGIDLFDASNALIGTVLISGNKTSAEDNSAPFYGIVSTNGDIRFASFWIDQSYNPNLPPKAGDIAINTMDVLVPEPASLALLGTGLMGLAGLRRRAKR